MGRHLDRRRHDLVTHESAARGGGAGPREFRLSPLAVAINLLATSPLVLGGPLVMVVFEGDSLALALGLSLFLIGAYGAVRVPVMRLEWDDESVRVVGMLWSQTIRRSRIEEVSTTIERPSITWRGEGGARLTTPLSVLRFTASSLAPLAPRKRRARVLEELARWAEGDAEPIGGSSDVAPTGEQLRRTWRARHRPAIRRSDPVWDLGGWVLPGVSFIAVVTALGLSRRSSISLETSAIALTGEAVIAFVMLGTLSLRRLQGKVPDRYPRLMLGGCALALTASAVIISLRAQDALSAVGFWPVSITAVGVVLALVLLLAAPRGRTPPAGR